MEKVIYYPKNKEYFSELISSVKKLFKICTTLKIKPIVYGSVAYAFYTRDEKININDIDLLVSESSFPKIISKIKQDKELRYEETNYHSLKIFKGNVKITFDAIESYYANLPNDFIKVKINGVLYVLS